ncbi:MAG: YggT family protein [Gammaproteobacteria bacterium]|nr:YggT family protein [Gammaproteobacteria bacterium]
MTNGYLSNAALYLVEAISGLYMMLVLLRFLLQKARASFHNPFSQFIVKVTNPPLKPLRRVIPGWGGVDLAALVLLFALQMATLALIYLILGQTFNLAGMGVLAVAELLNLTLTTYLITVIAQAILSWVGPGGPNPLSGLLYSLNEPLLRPVRRLLPLISGIDLSPLVVLIIIQLLKILAVAPLADLGRALGH